ncbi:uncharacterized protein LOC125435936 [Sphaerodactylus townsendi]|uniref:uncharacterized protein LOC125435936 n=1 Tax=Sphaerodactylus townsendi TaxID=933632 RepID=UPI002025BF5A|nr:uncharacterized protein LOC125435936 [Sphaerodactylus townsendi]
MVVAMDEGSRPIDYDVQRDQGEAPFTSPEGSQALPPDQGPQPGDKLLQELGRLHMERETCRPQDWKELEAAHAQETQEFFESEGRGATELEPHLPQDLERQRKQSHQLPLVEQKISPLPGQEKENQESPEMFNMESGSRGSPKLEAPQTSQRQECLPETSPVVPMVRVFHPLNSQEFMDPAIFCPQESSEIEWEPLEDKEIQMDLGHSELQEHLPGTLQWKSKSLDPRKLSRTWGQRGTDGLHAQHEEHRELIQETTETKKPPVVTAFSPPSPGRHKEEIAWEPAALRVGMSRENSSCEVPSRRPSEQSWQAQDEDVPTEGAPEPTQPEGQEEPRARPLPSPRPPRREKAFIWLSRQEQEEALKQLAELRAEGELRHRRDKERQSLRFQERLSIAKHRKSEDDILGGSPAERWPSPTEHLDQEHNVLQGAAGSAGGPRGGES